jgi:predicted ATPase
MTKLKVHNFGPIKVGFSPTDGFFDIAKLTIFVGNQGSGKSTVAKLISTFSWIEKALVRGDYTADWFVENGNFKETFLAYHRIQNYLQEDTELHYRGEAYSIKYLNQKLAIEKNKNVAYELPQIMYIPAERNIISNIENVTKLKILSPSLIDFVGEYNNVLNSLTKPLALPINDAYIEYNKTTKTTYVSSRDYRVSLSESASGFQSIVPLFLVSVFLGEAVKNTQKSNGMSSAEKERFGKMTSEIMADTNMTDEQKRIAISEIGKKFNKTAFINIIEEPEQNLFPVAQEQLLWRLLAINNTITANKLIITTHSPYFINYLTLAVEAMRIKNQSKTVNITSELNDIIPLDSAVNISDVALYELHDGIIQKLEPCEDLPSDENALNRCLGSANDSFSRLMELEQRLCL